MLELAYELTGGLKYIKPFNLNDLNFCVESRYYYNHIKFGHNFEANCNVDIFYLINMYENSSYFIDLYLNYTENNINLLKPVPILIRDAFSHNYVSIARQGG